MPYSLPDCFMLLLYENLYPIHLCMLPPLASQRANLKNVSCPLGKLPPLLSQPGIPKNRCHNPDKLSPLIPGPFGKPLSNDPPVFYWNNELDTTRNDSKIAKFDSK